MTSIRKLLWISLGTIFLILGVIGIFVPLIPTTGPLLASAACYMRGSQRWYNWLINNRYLGSYIRNFRDKRGMPLRAKVVTLVILWPTLAVSAWAKPVWWLWLMLLAVGIGVSWLMWKLPTLQLDPQGNAMPNAAEPVPHSHDLSGSNSDAPLNSPVDAPAQPGHL